MGYSGYTQYICENGHSYSEDAYENGDGLCHHCKAKPVWANSVDQTNGQREDDPRSNPIKLVVKTPQLVSDPYAVIAQAIKDSGGHLSEAEIRKAASLLSSRLLRPETYHVPVGVGYTPRH